MVQVDGRVLYQLVMSSNDPEATPHFDEFYDSFELTAVDEEPDED